MTKDLPPEISRLLTSPDPDDRAYAAFRLGGERPTTSVLSALRDCLTDQDSDVVAFAAQSLALHADVDSLPNLVSLVQKQSGGQVTPVAWAVASLAASAPDRARAGALAALEDLRRRGSADVKRQIKLLLGDADAEA